MCVCVYQLGGVSVSVDKDGGGPGPAAAPRQRQQSSDPPPPHPEPRRFHHKQVSQFLPVMAIDCKLQTCQSCLQNCLPPPPTRLMMPLIFYHNRKLESAAHHYSGVFAWQVDVVWCDVVSCLS